ncbi:MAG: hypothetical protein Q8K24_16745 [Hydrogenophaga sp.]|nr:hypothetical protein [Hydrogenophaga sp.]
MGATLVLLWNSVGWWLALLPAGVLGWVLLRHVLPTLLARFNGAALRLAPPPGTALPTAGPLDAGQRTAWEALASWCHAGTGDGRRPWWRPGALPRVDQRLTVALLQGGSNERHLALAEAFSRELDGSHLLSTAGGRWAGLWLRLRVKRDDVQWWRTRQPADPWDCGYLAGDPAGREALRHFRPRRATLVVAAGLPPEVVREALLWLGAHQHGFAHPVRLLWLEPSGKAESTDHATVIRLGPG